MRKFLSPKRIKLALRGVKSVRRGGGPRRIKLIDLTEPKGLLVGTSMATFEVEAVDGSVETIETPIPIPFLYSWGYRIGRKLHLPILSRFDPKKVKFDFKVPRRGKRGAAGVSA
jgi:hypothetical protein